MSWWKPDAGKKMLKRIHQQKMEWQYWFSLYESIHNGQRRNAWDYQLILTLFRFSQLCAVPAVNLISNVGYGDGATHCADDDTPLANMPRKEMEFPLRHPVSVWHSGEMDHAIFKIRILDKYRPPSLGERAVSKVASVLPAAWKTRIKAWMGILIGAAKR